MIIAIDGYSGTGKSSTALAVARKLGISYLDTGAMYRAVSFSLRESYGDRPSMESVLKILENLDLQYTFVPSSGKVSISVQGSEIEESDLRGQPVTSMVSYIASLQPVREKMVRIQRSLASEGGLVADGRDIGTYVFPDAGLKVFLSADLEVRSRRRCAEMEAQGVEATLQVVRQNLSARDKTDSERLHHPLRRAADAILIDTTLLTFETQVNTILYLARHPEQLKDFVTSGL